MEPTMREIRPVELDNDGTLVWEDVDTGARWNSGELPEPDELYELERRKGLDCE